MTAGVEGGAHVEPRPAHSALEDKSDKAMEVIEGVKVELMDVMKGLKGLVKAVAQQMETMQGKVTATEENVMVLLEDNFVRRLMGGATPGAAPGGGETGDGTPYTGA